ncbi:MAG: cation diffusion facilitator family transporter [Proteobacteria bacterium]|nr:cation diffusion facilitator family transporter [Pseudomonadota bacterium]
MARSHHHAETDIAALRKACMLISSFMLVELAVGLWANALVLIADAGHMFLDATALALAWWAAHLSERGFDQQHSYGYHRFQVLAAFVNGLTLVGLIFWLIVEAVQRLIHPESMDPWPTLIIASLGFIVNLMAFRLLHNTSGNTNIRSAALHVLGDLLGSAAAIFAAAVVMIWGWLYADPSLTLIIVVILGRGAYGVLRESAHILLEGVPAGVNLAQIKTTLTDEIKDVDGVHHVHAWGLTAEKPLLTLHALIPENAEVQQVVADIKRLLKERFDIEHSTVQVELGPCPDDMHDNGH